MFASKSDADPATDPVPDAFASAVHLLHRAGQCADEIFSISLTGGLMTPRQYAVMKAVEAATDPSQTTIVDMTGIDRSTIADIVRRLVERGFVQRRRTRKDARMYVLRLTVKGQAAIRSAEPSARETDEKLLAALAPAEREAFVDCLRRIVTAIGPISSARISK